MDINPYNSFLTSGWYRLMLWSATLPLVYFIMMVIGGMRRQFRFSILGIIWRTFIGWILIMAILTVAGLYFGFAMKDLGAFMNAKTENIFIKYYPVAVFLIAAAGFYYPRADCFNKNKTLFRRRLLLVVCFTPFYLMVLYIPFIQSNYWMVSIRFGLLSSSLGFLLSLPIIFHGNSDSLTQAFSSIIKFMFHTNHSNSNRNPLAKPDFPTTSIGPKAESSSNS